MVVERTTDGWFIIAPWMETPVRGDTFEDAYWEARRAAFAPGRRR